VTLAWLRRNKPSTWQEVTSDDGRGWKWLDESGRERLRYTRPTGESSNNAQWARQVNGKFEWRNASGQRLDVDGNVVDTDDPEFARKVHIDYEGPQL